MANLSMRIPMPQLLQRRLVGQAQQHHPKVIQGEPPEEGRGAQGLPLPEEVEGKGQVASVDDVVLQGAQRNDGYEYGI